MIELGNDEKVLFIKVILQFVIIEKKMTNVLHGRYKQAKCYMIIKKQFIMIML